MLEEIFVAVYGGIVMLYVALNIRKGGFIFDASKLVPILIFVFAMAFAALALLGITPAVAGVIPMIAAAVGLFRFNDEFGPSIFYARNHIAGVIDTVASLIMIFVGILIFRIDLVAVGFFFFLLLPFSSNALANAYYYSYHRRLEK
jgi:multisubunit Na+/H+ antiporter MnhG subunit